MANCMLSCLPHWTYRLHLVLPPSAPSCPQMGVGALPAQWVCSLSVVMPVDDATGNCPPQDRAQRWALASGPQGQTVCSLSPSTMAGSWTHSELIKVIFPSKPLPRGLNTNEPPAQRRGLLLPSSAGQWLCGDSLHPHLTPWALCRSHY